jgi:peptidoglycan L-alanyl-D-glutamate endopeptidase CwlK
MAFSNVSNERLALVHPELARRVRNLEAMLSAGGVQIQVAQGIRTASQQDALYAEGRTLPGKRVTDARGFQSNHVIGCAVDVFPEDSHGQPDWNASHPDWQRILAAAPACGLRDGICWHDMPHLELQEIPTEPTAAIQETCKLEGVPAAWKALDVPTFDSPALGPAGSTDA